MRIALCMAALVVVAGCSRWEYQGGDDDDDANQPPCPGGTDADHDGYGEDCPDGPDCDDSDPYTNPGQAEHCDGEDNDCDGQVDEGVINDCGTCDEGCLSLGTGPFPVSTSDPNAEEDGVGIDDSGDLVLDQTEVEYSYLWVANTNDLEIGTVSKIDGDSVAEAGRYLTVTCNSDPATPECDDVAGNEVQITYNTPSRTAVDFNFDVWVANRGFEGQASVTKIANDPEDCTDHNGNGQIDTSADQDGDGVITTDCDGDGYPDTASTTCTNGLPPEFYYTDDECILFTVNYGATNDIGRSVCLDAGELSPDGVHIGPGNAWVGTNNRSGNNQFYKLDGETGELLATADLPSAVLPYGCAVDGHGILWANGGWSSANLTWIDTEDPTQVGTDTTAPPWAPPHLYGIAVDEDQNLWVAGYDSQTIYRYEPDRSSYLTLNAGVWSAANLGTSSTAGIAADNRGFIWVAENDEGYVRRVDPTQIPSGGEVTLAATDRWGPYGATMRGVGVDFRGNVWGVSYTDSSASRLEVDATGTVTNDLGGEVSVGINPYTYSDFTGYGLRVFTNPHGTWSYVIEGCGEDTFWHEVSWVAYEPVGTEVLLRARTGPAAEVLGEWSATWDTSPADLNHEPGGPIAPNPAPYLQIQFEMYSDGQENSPVISALQVTWSCS